MKKNSQQQQWDHLYPNITKSWTTHWVNLRTLFEYPPEIRKAILYYPSLGGVLL